MAARSVHGAALAAIVLAVCWQATGAGEGVEQDADVHAGRAAIAAVTRGSHKTALRIFREALSSPCPEGSSSAGVCDRWRLRLQLAQVLVSLGHSADALSEYRRVLAATLGSPEHDQERGMPPLTLAAVTVEAAAVMREVSDPTQAAHMLAQAMDLHPHWRGQAPLATECAARRVLADTSDFFWQHVRLAQCLAQREHYDPAAGAQGQMQALLRATELKPDLAHAYNDLGLRFGHWHERGELPRSAALLSVAVSLEPAHGVYCVNLAMAYQHLGHLHQAAAWSRRAAELAPGNAQVLRLCVWPGTAIRALSNFRAAAPSRPDPVPHQNTPPVLEQNSSWWEGPVALPAAQR